MKNLIVMFEMFIFCDNYKFQISDFNIHLIHLASSCCCYYSFLESSSLAATGKTSLDSSALASSFGTSSPFGAATIFGPPPRFFSALIKSLTASHKS